MPIIGWLALVYVAGVALVVRALATRPRITWCRLVRQLGRDEWGYHITARHPREAIRVLLALATPPGPVHPTSRHPTPGGDW